MYFKSAYYAKNVIVSTTIEVDKYLLKGSKSRIFLIELKIMVHIYIV